MCKHTPLASMSDKRDIQAFIAATVAQPTTSALQTIRDYMVTVPTSQWAMNVHQARALLPFFADDEAVQRLKKRIWICDRQSSFSQEQKAANQRRRETRMARCRQGEYTKAQTLEDAVPILRFFEYAHLPEHLQAVSKAFHSMAHQIATALPKNAERSMALRKLLEAKDCAVRAALPARNT